MLDYWVSNMMFRATNKGVVVSLDNEGPQTRVVKWEDWERITKCLQEDKKRIEEDEQSSRADFYAGTGSFPNTVESLTGGS